MEERRLSKMLAFLNSGLGLLLVGALLGVIGLFTWQRQDWVFKQAYLRAEAMLDRRLNLIEAINADVGALVADADSVIAAIAKQAPRTQINQVVEVYNEEQARWFGAAPAHAALLGFYFPPVVAEQFTEELVKSTQALDVAIYRVVSTSIESAEAWQVSGSVRAQLQSWNTLAMNELQPD
jgi:hypothetical protein